MSGFVAILNPDGSPVDRVLLEQMTRFLSLRGPDAQETWVNGNIGLGHALLRTTYESEQERQPLTLDGHVWITGDARLDGRGGLIGALRARGRNVNADAPDAALILHAYAFWETKCVEHLIGDFAFALWDARTQTVFCARDQFGVVPVYYALVESQSPHHSFQRGDSSTTMGVPTTILLSNTLECVRMHPRVSAELNDTAIADWLLFRNNQDMTTTTFRTIRRLPPAHTLTWNQGGINIQRYWSLPQHMDFQFRSPADTIAQFRHLFTQAVQDRLRTPRIVVPMSGGMDSSSVAVTAQRLLQNAQQPDVLYAYTLTTDLPHDREHYYAGLVAAHAQFPLEFMPLTASGAPDRNAGAVPPEPGGMPGAESSQLAQRGATESRVSLSGVGGDPLFMPSQAFLLNLLRRGQVVNAVRAMAQSRHLQGTLPPLYLRSSLKRRVRGEQTYPFPRWLNPDFAARLDLRARWEQVNAEIQRRDPRRGMAESPFWSNFFAQWDPGYTHRQTKLLHPFFDVRLLEFILTVPPVPWFVNKTLLREAMRGALPEPVRRRKKTPLGGNPMQQPHSPEWIRELAMTPELQAYVNREALVQIVQAPEQVSAYELANVSQPLALAYWLRGIIKSK